MYRGYMTGIRKEKNLRRSTIFLLTIVLLGAGIVAAQPAAPILLSPDSAGIVDYPVADLSWNSAMGDSSYDVQISTVNDFSSILAEDATLTIPTYTISRLDSGMTYYWRVRVTDYSQLTSQWSSVWSFSSPSTWVLPALTLAAPADGAVGQMTEIVNLKWNPLRADSIYQVQVSTDNTFTSPVFDFTVDSTTPMGTAAGLNSNTWYFWRARAVLLGGATNPWSSVRIFKTERFAVTGHTYWKRWHTMTMTLDGPECSETGTPNPFTDYRLIVTFKQMESGGEVYVMPGYFAADGNAGETHATSGNKWRVHFMDQWPGIYTWVISFRYGSNIAASDSALAGNPLDSIDGDTGRINNHTVGDHDNGTDDVYPSFLNLGKVGYQSNLCRHYLMPNDYKNPLLLLGAASPSNFLSYADFDNTPERGSGYLRTWDRHISDWNAADTVDSNSTWGGNAQLGKGILGAINYLASRNVKSLSFTTMNIGSGGDENVYPFVDPDSLTRYDCSKLDQWQKVFSHAEDRGVFFALKIQMPGNQTVLNGGDMGVERTVYCRELIARFSHNLAIGWHLGDGNTQSTIQQRAMARYFRSHDPFGDHNVTGPRSVLLGYVLGNDSATFTPFLNDSAINTVSLETGIIDMHRLTRKWTYQSDLYASENSFVVISGVQAPYNIGTPQDTGTGNPAYQDSIRKYVLWGNLMAKGGGVTYYFGSDPMYGDLVCQSFRSRQQMWDYNDFAARFFRRYLYPEGILTYLMGSADTLISNTETFCLANARQDNSQWPPPYYNCDPYVVYLPSGGTTDIDIHGIDSYDATYTLNPFLRVWWYNPRTGDTLSLQKGARLERLTGDAFYEQVPLSIGSSPTTGEDWVALIVRDTGTTYIKLFSPPNRTYGVDSMNPGTLSWNADAGAVSYRLQVATSPDFSSLLVDSLLTNPLDTSVVLSGPLVMSTVYFWRVYEAVNLGGGTTGWSQTYTFATSPDLVLSSPANGAIDVYQNPTLAWHAVAGAASYRVQISKASDFSSIVKDRTVSDTSAYLFADSSLLELGTKYYWRAREIRASGSIAAWSSAWSFTVTAVGVLPRTVQLNTLNCAMSRGVLKYVLPKQCYVSVSYYDLRGRRVGSFVNMVQNAGYYSMSVPVSRWSRGVYIQVFKAGDFVKRDKLVFVK